MSRKASTGRSSNGDRMTRDKDGFIVLEPAEGKELVRDSKGRLVFKKAKLKPAQSDDFVAPSIVTIEEPLGQYVRDKSIVAGANINIGRSLPWLEDGLKFVERRVLYTMFKAKWTANNPHVKVATIVGRMIETVYPHGEAAPAQTIYRLGRDFQAMLPYIDASGNFGNALTMEAAAPRYAAARLSKYAMDCFFSEEDGIGPVYDVKEAYNKNGYMEPIYLSTRFPNVLMQWNFGIGKGVASTFVAFNSTDIFETALKLIDRPNAKVEIYPDTPTNLNIVNKNQLKNCFDQTNFKVKVQAPYYVDTIKGPDGKDKQVIIFESCPMQTSGDIIEKQIRKIKADDEARNSDNKRFPEIIDVNSSAKPKGRPGELMFVIEYEQGYDPHALAEKIIKSTNFGMSYGANYTVAHNYQPHVYTPRQVLLEWIKIRFDQKRRYFTQKKKMASRDKARTLALIQVLGDKKHGGIDECIRLIKSSKDDNETKEKLRSTFGLTEYQAIIIMDLKLKTLNNANIENERAKYKAACEAYDKYMELCKEANVRKAIKDDLRYGLATYSMKRRGKLMDSGDEVLGAADDEKIIVYNTKQFFCIPTHDDLVKISGQIDSSYRTIKVSNSSGLVLFNKKGQMKVLNGFSFNYTNTGIAMEKIAFDDVVNISIISEVTGKDLAMITKRGYGKIMNYNECGKSIKGKVITLNDDDELVAILPVTQNGIVGLVADDNAYYVRTDSIPTLKRSAAGNRLIKGKTEVVISSAVYIDNESQYILVYGESGYIKILDTGYLGFSKKTANCISMKGKAIYNLVPLDKKKTHVTLYNAKGATGITITFGDRIQFETTTGFKKAFPMSTSIGNPVKLLSVGKHEFYQII